ncbi:MAG: T9SS type A sorting domain-containing protein [Dysgonamonadaceae bacterium]|jgi:hypothetical protein|nr:T9SS type A sorting domain-containing protein [Dysgonamonadaceae bacterium]
MKKTMLILCSSFGVLFAAAAQDVPTEEPLTVGRMEHTVRLMKQECTSNIYINVGDPTSIEEIPFNERPYPTVVTDVLTIPLPEGTGSNPTILLLDKDGKVLQQQTVAGNAPSCQLSFAPYPSGLYFVQLISSGKRTYKIVKTLQ